jgi:hypothetical protein
VNTPELDTRLFPLYGRLVRRTSMIINRASGYLLMLAVAMVPLLAQQSTAESKPVTRTATIVAIDKTNRIVTLKGEKEGNITVKAPDQMEGFDSLKVGDQVTATYFEAVVVRVRKPGDPPASPDPQTTVTRKDRTAGSEVRREQTYTVTIESLDMTGRTVRVKRGQEPAMTLGVRDPKNLQGLRVGDTVDVTFYESLLVKVARPPK